MKALRILFLLVLAGFGGTVARAEPLAPQPAIEKFHATLLDIMQRSKALGYQGRYDTVKPVVDATFDLPGMAEVAAGPPWRNLTDDQRKQFVDVFSRFTYATYAYRFDDYDGERFETVGQQDGRNNTVLVNTRLVRPKDEPVTLNYLFHPSENGSRVIDIFLKGAFSELATRRSEYAAIIQRDGFPTLIDKLEEKITDYAKGKK